MPSTSEHDEDPFLLTAPLEIRSILRTVRRHAALVRMYVKGNPDLSIMTTVLAFDEGASAEVVDEGRTGFLCRDEAHMAEMIERVPELDRVACRAAVENHFSAERMVAEYLELFSQLFFEPLAERPLREFGAGGKSTDVWKPTPAPKRR